VQLLAGAEAGEDYVLALVGRSSGGAEHVAGEVEDADGLAHLKHGDVARRSSRSEAWRMSWTASVWS
jgi:hypothetical protein